MRLSANLARLGLEAEVVQPGWVDRDAKPLETGTKITSGTGQGGRLLLYLHMAALLAHRPKTA